MKIVLDAMGGDFAPKNEVQGALMALRAASNRFEVLLVGDEAKLRPLLQENGYSNEKLTVVHASEVITMSDSPALAMKQKKDSSMVRGLTLCKEGNGDAFVSCGNTGAQMACSLFILGRSQGVLRPTIGTPFPSEAKNMMIFDAGANVDSKPEHLLQYAEMGSIYQKLVYGNPAPRVGLLNIGEEETKGTDLIQETYGLLKEASEKGKINFVGNIEGRDILMGSAEIILCDGFVGNIVLKFGESVPKFLKARFAEFAKKSLFNKLLIGLMRQPLRAMFRTWDPNEFGGVPLLGLNGVSLISHGKSSPRGIMNMIFRAEEVVNLEVTKKIAEALRKEKV
ncbi:MAG: phosphate acyltransferase PlsX [Chloroherpetonaceae bacterium]|nr:phosphate acyltransferase PlsX [Chloroherpetonaceae bacterium]